MDKPVGVGIVGCGAISGEYLKQSKKFPILNVVACADIIPQAAEKKAAEFGVPRACSVKELLADENVEIVLNLAVPKVHASLAMAALNAGKHTYLEKPLAVTRKDGLAILAKAKAKKLQVGCAPDTFMGSGLQTCRKLIDDGAIGRPVAFTAFMMCPGHEHWHPNPEFHYQLGGGPMFDMGPYYLTALLNMLGPVKRLTSLSRIAIPKRTITSPAKFGKVVKVQTPDHVTGSIEFADGAVGVIVQSFATHFGQFGVLTIHGTEGALHLPDPNHFAGPVRLRNKGDAEWKEIPHVFQHDYGRSVGLADMAEAIRNRRAFRASGQQGMVVLDLMQGFLDSSKSGKVYVPKLSYKRPAPLPIGTDFGVFV
ncbi:MAG TPA: Gfo/Idh/MocA family oxidoreductase [Tepidisphaeraceae bacterium]|nr:Gfo/Idh/MocA family oxidoreductase [Tepidisphaeraceae bacterium]